MTRVLYTLEHDWEVPVNQNGNILCTCNAKVENTEPEITAKHHFA